MSAAISQASLLGMPNGDTNSLLDLLNAPTDYY